MEKCLDCGVPPGPLLGQSELHTMKRLDQGHLHSKLEVPGLTCHGRESNPGFAPLGEHSRKDPFEQLVNSYSERLHMSTRQ